MDSRRAYSEEILPTSIKMAAPEKPTTNAPVKAKRLRIPRANNTTVDTTPTMTGIRKFFFKLAWDALRHGI